MEAVVKVEAGMNDPSPLGPFRGFLGRLAGRPERGSRERPVMLAPMSPRVPTDSAFPESLQAAVRSPFVADTLTRIFGGGTVAAVDRGPSILGSVHADRPTRLQVSPEIGRRLGEGTEAAQRQYERTLTHEAAHSLDFQTPVIPNPLRGGRPNPFRKLMTGLDSEFRGNRARIAGSGPAQGFFQAQDLNTSPAYGYHEYRAQVMDMAVEAVREKSRMGLDEWESAVSSSEERFPGIREAIQWVESQLERS